MLLLAGRFRYHRPSKLVILPTAVLAEGTSDWLTMTIQSRM